MRESSGADIEEKLSKGFPMGYDPLRGSENARGWRWEPDMRAVHYMYGATMGNHSARFVRPDLN